MNRYKWNYIRRMWFIIIEMKTLTLEKPAHQFCKKRKKNVVNKSKHKKTRAISKLYKELSEIQCWFTTITLFFLYLRHCVSLFPRLFRCVVYACMFAILVKLLITVHFDSSVVLPARISNNQYNHYSWDSLKYLSCAWSFLTCFHLSPNHARFQYKII